MAFTLYRSSFNDKGLPESIYMCEWKGENIPASGIVNLVLTGYKDGKFYATVDVSITPDIDISQLLSLQKLLLDNPQNIFIIHEATGGNPFEINSVDPYPIKKYENNKMVKEYYNILNDILKQYHDFGSKYVHEIKKKKMGQLNYLIISPPHLSNFLVTRLNAVKE